MIYDNPTVWLVILFAGGLTYCLRLSFIVGMEYFKEPDWLQKFLRHVPAAVLSGLICAGLFLKAGQVQFDIWDPRYPAALLASFVAWRTKNILWTILSGMGALWLGQWLIHLFAG